MDPLPLWTYALFCSWLSYSNIHVLYALALTNKVGTSVKKRGHHFVSKCNVYIVWILECGTIISPLLCLLKQFFKKKKKKKWILYIYFEILNAKDFNSLKITVMYELPYAIHIEPEKKIKGKKKKKEQKRRNWTKSIRIVRI